MQRWFCLAVTPMAWRCTLRKSRPLWRPARTPCCCWTKPVGTAPPHSSFLPTSPCCRCHQNAPSLIQSKTSGSSCATTGSQTESSNPTTTFSTIAASPGTASSGSHGASCQSDRANGQWVSISQTWYYGIKPAQVFVRIPKAEGRLKELIAEDQKADFTRQYTRSSICCGCIAEHDAPFGNWMPV
ncbi:hypothetical protein SAMN04488059_13627 [Devosia psychrophila]|uniref:Uncharacterized protein n=1 Tax=Devosia psychrophila TaxID=728005 RepID=A0A1I1RDQ1_9HYPH|nr:hypothetical protein SAMN04488059_13627 [Devosia psychrophila]